VHFSNAIRLVSGRNAERTVIQSALSPADLIVALRRELQVKVAADVPANLRSVGVWAVTARALGDGSFRVITQGSRSVINVEVVATGRVSASPNAPGTTIVLTFGTDAATRLRALVVAAFTLALGVKGLAGAGATPGISLVLGAAVMWLAWRAEVARCVAKVRPGLVHLLEKAAGGATGSAQLAVHTAPARLGE